MFTSKFIGNFMFEVISLITNQTYYRLKILNRYLISKTDLE